MKTMAPFEVVNAVFTRMVRDATIELEDFARITAELWERSGWTPAEFFAVRRGDVIEVEATAD